MLTGIIDSGQKIITDGLVLHLDAAQLRSYPGSGTTWTDLSGNGNSGTLTNSPTFDSANGGSLNFDGINDYLALSAYNNLNFQYGSQEIWVQLDAVNPTGPLQRILDRNNVLAGTFSFLYDGTNISARVRNTANTIAIVNYITPETNNWTCYSMTYDGTTIRAYINGNLDNSSTAISGAINTSGTYAMYIMSQNNINQFTDGKLSIVRMYNRALSATEILQNYNATKSRFGL